ncbi:MAG: BolA family protein, partial [Saccharospirillum sp.]
MSVALTIENKLAALEPSHLIVDNESHKHSVPENSETHFRVEIVSEAFMGIRAVQRHQKIYQLLQDE